VAAIAFRIGFDGAAVARGLDPAVAPVPPASRHPSANASPDSLPWNKTRARQEM
jgi:hypothetical protein